MNIKITFKKALAGVAVAAAAIAAPVHAEFLDFTVNENGVPVVPAAFQPLLSTFVADKISGQYNEVFTVTGPGTFATAAYTTLGIFSKNEGANAIQGNALNTVYQLYATFSATGNITNAGAGFQGTTGTINLYLDSFRSGVAGGGVTGLTLPANGLGAVGRTNTADDYLIASTSTFNFGQGHNNPGNQNQANGDFSLNFTDFVLTAIGQNYFVAPNPFYMNVTIDGNFGTFPLPGLNGSANITGASNAFFVVPEPGMLALMGIGLFGLALKKRRRA